MDAWVNDPQSGDTKASVASVRFSFYTAEEIRRLSVLSVTSPVAFDELGRPVPGGLYDGRFGVIEKMGTCSTCQLGFQNCPGHFGHIELSQPVLHPLLQSTMLVVLRSHCWKCHHFRLSWTREKLWLARFKFASLGEWECLEGLADAMNRLAVREQSASTGTAEFVSDVAENPGMPAANDVSEWVSVSEEMWEKRGSTARRTTRQGSACSSHVHAFLDECGSLSRCPRCGIKSGKWRRDGAKFFFQPPGGSTRQKRSREVADAEAATDDDAVDVTIHKARDLDDNGNKTVLLLPQFLVHQMTCLYERSPDLCRLVFCAGPPGPFFLDALLVAPSRFRMPSPGDSEDQPPREHAQNFHYTRVIQWNVRVHEAMQGASKHDLSRVLYELQSCIQDLFDSEAGQDMRRAPGIRQQLEHKEGLFRMRLMGKRVNYSARSVISPDPFLDTNEVGVPRDFARKLTVPESVFDHNLERLKLAVVNGPNVHPGANLVEAGDGSRVQLRQGLLQQRHVQAETLFEEYGRSVGYRLPKRVMRHMQSGDIVLFNRQPSLHRVSLMAHRVRILGAGEKTLRMHYANCGSYNADFDGDEMNLHFPQDLIAQSEARVLALTDVNYIVPTSGAPIRGLIQDHIVAAVLLTKRDTFLSRQAFWQLFYASTEHLWELMDERNSEIHVHQGEARNRYQIPIPAILKPTPLWTGKQLLSALLCAVISSGNRSSGPVYRHLKLLARTKTSSIHWGTSANEEASFLVLSGELVHGVVDKAQIGASEFGLVHAVYELFGAKIAGHLLSCLGRLLTLFIREHGYSTGIEDLLLKPSAERIRQQLLDQAQRQVGDNAAQQVLHRMAAEDMGVASNQQQQLAAHLVGHHRREMEMRLDSEMKGALADVGSRILEECVPNGLRRHFPMNGFLLMTATGAKGSQVNASQISCLLGSTVLEGKRVPRTSAGWTLPSFAPFEDSAAAGGFISGRFLTGMSPQEYFFHCMAGREGLVDTAVKTARSGYLQRCLIKSLEALIIAYDGTVRESDGSVIQFIYGEDGLDPCKCSWLLQRPEWLSDVPRVYRSTNWSKEEDQYETLVRDAENMHTTVLERASPNPVSILGAVSDSFATAIENMSLPVKRYMRDLYRRASAQPGEAVGVVAAQSIGEPSTQMTLNTFHFAGMGAGHVTLGIPRLREILMFAARKPSTPAMHLPIPGGVSLAVAERLKRKLRCVRLRDLVQSITFSSADPPGRATTTLSIELELVHGDAYFSYLDLTTKHVEACLSGSFSPLLKSYMARRARELGGLDAAAKLAQALPIDVTDDELATRSDHLEPHDEEDAIDPGKRAEPNRPPQFAVIDQDSSSDESDAASDDERRQRTFHSSSRVEESASDEETQEATADAQDDLPERVMVRDELRWASTANERTASSSGGIRLMRREDVDVAEVRIAVPPSLWHLYLFDEMTIKALELSIVRNVDGIEQAFLDTDVEGKPRAVTTTGSNFEPIWNMPGDAIDLHRIQSNDIYQTLIWYGVEAARALIILQLGSVFQAYGIPVDHRHLMLIADYQTALGGYRPFSRTGMRVIGGTPSALQKMSFESTTQFLCDAALSNESDPAQSPSARICLGQVVNLGTGTFSLLSCPWQPIQEAKRHLMP